LTPIPAAPTDELPIWVFPENKVSVPVGAFPKLVVKMLMFSGIVVPTPVASGGWSWTVVEPFVIVRLRLAEELGLKLASPL
jgi:hypothetical protein